MKFRLFSERESAQRGGFPPPTNLKTFPQHLRRNLIRIFDETLGEFYVGHLGVGNKRVETSDLWIEFDRIMERESEEYGIFCDRNGNDDSREHIINFIASSADPDLLNLLDVGIFIIDRHAREFQKRRRAYLEHWGVRLAADEALVEIDTRLREHGTVYRVADGAIVVSTDDFTHENVVSPALRVLGEPGFENPSRELHEALDAYRNGKYDIVLIKANHAFESAMKIIAGKMGWAYDQNATAKKLIELLFFNELMPAMRDPAMKALATMMESDVPRLRNKMPSAGHGAGEKEAIIPEPFAKYVISAVAANIQLLVASYQLKRLRRG
jgi:hypothetical protein